MFAPNSRYQSLAAKPNTFTTPDGRQLPYVPRRFLPLSAAPQLPQSVKVGPNERLDQVSARVLGDAEQFWRLCDANDAMDPFMLIDDVNYRLRVPSPHDANQWASALSVSREARLPAPRGRAR